jgi:hypothetical protein
MTFPVYSGQDQLSRQICEIVSRGASELQRLEFCFPPLGLPQWFNGFCTTAVRVIRSYSRTGR